jgi:hypothetical protein
VSKGTTIAAAVVAVVVVAVVSNSHYRSYLEYSPSYSSAASASGCQVSDFTLDKTQANLDGYGYVRLTGIVHNGCSYAMGVKLKWTVYNSDGTIAFSNDFYPANTTNIPPNTDYPFETMNSAPRGKSQYTVEPISLQQW